MGTSSTIYQARIMFLAAVVLFIAGSVYVYEFFIDDTLISLRFAKNLVDYGQLSFNPGDQPVEGYTNFLLVLLEALFLKMGVENVLNTPKIIGILSGILSIMLTYQISARLLPGEAGNLKYIPMFALAVSPSLAIWAVGGLETTLNLLFILCGVYFFIAGLESNSLKDLLRSDISFMLGFLCRPDSLLFWALSYLFIILFYRKVEWRNRIYSLTVSGVLISSYLLWKYLYFGSLLPTTYFAKVDNLNIETILLGLQVYYGFIKSGVNYLFLALLPLAAWSVRKKLYSGISYLLFLFTGFSAYVVYLGSPVMAHAFRFHVPILPLLYLLGAYGLWMLLNSNPLEDFRYRNVLVGVWVVIMVAVGAYQLHYNRNVDFNWAHVNGSLNMKEVTEVAQTHSNLASWIAQEFPPLSVIAAGDVGAIGYYSNGKIIDTWSLMDKNIIQLRKEQRKYPMGSEQWINIERNQIARYVLDQNPVLIVLDYVDYSADPRADKYVRLTNLGVDDQHFFVREDFLREPPGPQDLRLSEVKSGYK